MGTEIERKFLIVDDSWREGRRGVPYRQGYLMSGPPVSVRVRLAKGKAILNIKKAKSGIERDEFEYPIPVKDAQAILADLCEGYIIEKTRYKVRFGGLVWEIDVFEGDNRGLVVAEVELRSKTQPFKKPAWLGKEITKDARYYNARLSRRPYSQWGRRKSG